jgi:hypothetical protein
MIEHLLTDCKTHEKLSQPAKHAWEPEETSAPRTPRFAFAVREFRSNRVNPSAEN